MLLCTYVGVLDVDPRTLEERMGVSPRFLHRLFNNFIEFRVQYLFAILAALEIEPAEFFALAYPDLPAEPSHTAAELRRRLRDLTPEARERAIGRAGRPTRLAPGSVQPVRRQRFPGTPTRPPAGRGVERSPRPEAPSRPASAPKPPPAALPRAAAPAAPAAGSPPEPLEDRLAGAIERVLRQILVEES